MAKKKNNKPRPVDLTFSRAFANYKPPENLSVSEWAERYRVLSRETSAEAGLWSNRRTPYLVEPMNAFKDPKLSHIIMAASSQVGKTEFMLNCLAYSMDEDPASTMFVQPSLEEMRKFSRLRITPMIRDSKPLKAKVADVRGRAKTDTVLQKTYPGGMLTMTGSNSPSGLASTPARYIFGDERDRWARSAGAEGDPWGLAIARQTTFYNSKAVEVSTPTIKGQSNIETSFYLGTQERWCHQCPECGEWHDIRFDSIKFEYEVEEVSRNKKNYKITYIAWACPSCGCLTPESVMRKQPAKWIAENPGAYERGVRSFWLNAFASPWMGWSTIVQRFLEARHDPERLKVVYNTLLGELWEDRGDLEDEDSFMARREEYPAELPEGVLVLTCGVDTQDNRLEYEVVGYGHYGENWGIKKGVIMGRPDSTEVWQRLDDVVDHVYRFENGKGLKISFTCVDSGGHYTQEVYAACRQRQNKRVFAIKGKGGQDIPFVGLPSRVPLKDNKQVTCWLYTIGVDAGKSKIISGLKVQEPGANYCHFPRGDRGYDATFFSGLLSEKMVLNRQNKWTWEKIPGHQRNEALDCRNYANAALRIIDPDMDAIERRLKGAPDPKSSQGAQQPKKPKKRTAPNRQLTGGGDW